MPSSTMASAPSADLPLFSLLRRNPQNLTNEIPKEIFDNSSHPPSDFSQLGMVPGIIASSVILSLISLFMTVARCYVRSRYAKFGVEDILTISAWIMCFVATVCMCNLTRAGVGRDAWNVPPEEVARNGMFSLMILISSTVHNAGMTFIKLSIVIFYRRVFPSVRFRRVCVAVAIFIGATGIGLTLPNIFQCEYIPDVIAKPENRISKCFDTNPLFRAGAIILTAGDLIVLAMPLPIIIKSGMDTQKKIHVTCVLLVGLLATIASIMRTHYTFEAPKLAMVNPTKTIAIMNLTGVIEIQLAIMCANAPALKNLIRRKLEASRNSSAQVSPDNSRGSGRSGGKGQVGSPLVRKITGKRDAELGGVESVDCLHTVEMDTWRDDETLRASGIYGVKV